MKSFWKWLRTKIEQSYNEEGNEIVEDRASGTIGGSHAKQRRGVKINTISKGESELGGKEFQFTIHVGQGGVVMSRYVYDNMTDRGDRRLHIISEEKDAAKEIGDIVAMEIMRG